MIIFNIFQIFDSLLCIKLYLVVIMYAWRLNGGYDNIGIGGHTSNALVDFTGGISESIDVRQKRSSPGDLFDVMYAMMQKCSMMACDIEVSSCQEYI